jgi:hypothetical protein
MSELAGASRSPLFDRHLWLALVLTACVVVPRTVLVSRAHSEYWDDQYHLGQGLSFVLRMKTGVIRNDPPLGQAVLSLPMLATGCVPPGPQDPRSAGPADSPPGAAPLYLAVLYGQRFGPETISMMVAAWKALLFLPLAGLVFHWCRRLYGLGGAWLALALVLVEPTIAGHVAPAALDVLGVEAILFACYVAWRFFESPTRRRIVVTGIVVAAAMLTKHTALILPAVVAAYAVAFWWHKRAGHVEGAATLRRRLNQVLAVGVVAFVSLWPLTLFDLSRPSEHGPLVNAEYTERFSFGADVVNGALMRRWPAGVYVGSIRGAQVHAQDGHEAYLWGERSNHGWWYYFLAVAAYKVPLGVALVLTPGVASLLFIKPRFDETPLIIAAAAWAVFLSAGGIDIGFRHFLPAYVPMLMLCGRIAAVRWRFVRWFAWCGVAAAAAHVALWHPDYLSYMNFPRDKPWLAISDSNIDWGQSLKQARRWLDEHPRGGRPVWLGYFGNLEGRSVAHYLGDRVNPLDDHDPAPKSGLLIISPVWVAGAYGHDQYAFLRGRDPDAVIGHNLLVYDLDRLANQQLSPYRSVGPTNPRTDRASRTS